MIAVAENPRARAARRAWSEPLTRARIIAGQLLAQERARVARVVESHEGLALAFARDMAPRYPDAEVDDLAQLARMGIAEAARRFDPARGCKFSTYAWIWARAEVTNARPSLRGGPIQAPRRPTAPVPSVGSFDDADQHGAPEPDDEGALDPFEVAAAAEERERVRLALGKLRNARDREVISMRFGLDGQPMNLREIGEVLGGISVERVRQLVARGLAELRAALSE